jgi:hypothetical protein
MTGVVVGIVLAALSVWGTWSVLGSRSYPRTRQDHPDLRDFEREPGREDG